MYSKEQIEEIQNGQQSNIERSYRLKERLILNSYKSEKSEQNAKHGINRRLTTIEHCIEQIFTLLPIELNIVPQPARTLDATIYVQAAVFHTWGLLDNIAWLWAFEKPILNDDGSELKRTQIGLSPKQKHIWSSFTDSTEALLQSNGDWFKHIKEFRDASAHRIPLYIPPSTIKEKHEIEIQELEAKKIEAIKSGNYEEIQEIESQKHALAFFQPIMLHSFQEKSPIVYFHPQIVKNFEIVTTILEKFMQDLEI